MTIPDASPEMQQLIFRLYHEAGSAIEQHHRRPQPDEWFCARVGTEQWGGPYPSAESAIVALVAWLWEIYDQAAQERDIARYELTALRSQVAQLATSLYQLTEGTNGT